MINAMLNHHISHHCQMEIHPCPDQSNHILITA